MSEGNYIYRESTDVNELESLLRLRDQVYRQSRLQGLVPENEYGIDLDCWDKNARHFGLFQKKFNQDPPIGYMRVVTKDENKYSGNLYKIAEAYSPTIFKKLVQPIKWPFPSMSYFPNADFLLSELECRLKDSAENLCEAGRFSFLPEARSLSLSRFMIECSIAVFYFGNKLYNGVIDCNDLHEAMYGHYGFKRVQGTTHVNIHNVNLLLLLLLLSNKRDLPIVLRDHLENMAEKYNMNEMICLRTNEPKTVSLLSIKLPPINDLR